MAAEQSKSTEAPLSGASAIDEDAGSSGKSSSDTWQVLPDEVQALMAKLAYWKEKAEEEEKLRKHAEAELKEYKQRAEKAEAHSKEAKEEGKMWLQKAAEEKALRVKAEAASMVWENKVERHEFLQKSAEKDLAETLVKAQQEEGWRRRLQEKTEAEQSLHKHYKQKANEEESFHRSWRDKAEEETKLRETAELAAAESETRAESAENRCRLAEAKAEQWMKEAEEERTLRRKCERSAEVEESLRKHLEEMMHQRQAQETKGCKEHVEEEEVPQEQKAKVPAAEAAKVEESEEREAAPLCRQRCIGPKHMCVTYYFKGFWSARRQGTTMKLYSDELRFEGDPELSHSFKLILRPCGRSPKYEGAVSLYWEPLPGSSDVVWPIPYEKVKLVLRIISAFVPAAQGTRRYKVKELVLDGTSEGFRAFVARNAPPTPGNGGFGDHGLLTKTEVETGEWTVGQWSDQIMVQAELLSL